MKRLLIVILGVFLSINLFSDELQQPKRNPPEKSQLRDRERADERGAEHVGERGNDRVNDRGSERGGPKDRVNPKLFDDMKSLIDNYHQDPNDENKTKLEEFFGKLYDLHIERKKQKVEELKQEIQDLETSIKDSNRDAEVAKKVEMVLSGEKLEKSPRKLNNRDKENLNKE